MNIIYIFAYGGEGSTTSYLNRSVPIDRLYYLYKNKRLIDDNRQGLYILKNNRTLKRYVGISTNMLHRIFSGHFKGYGNSKVFKDWLKGDDFSVTCISFDGTRKALEDYEHYVIEHLNTINEDYNVKA